MKLLCAIAVILLSHSCLAAAVNNEPARQQGVFFRPLVQPPKSEKQLQEEHDLKMTVPPENASDLQVPVPVEAPRATGPRPRAFAPPCNFTTGCS